jgi:hypothetical protein
MICLLSKLMYSYIYGANAENDVRLIIETIGSDWQNYTLASPPPPPPARVVGCILNSRLYSAYVVMSHVRHLLMFCSNAKLINIRVNFINNPYKINSSFSSFNQDIGKAIMTLVAKYSYGVRTIFETH